MNYNHSFHAGSFCDVFKHSVLIVLIQALLRKPNPFCYIDTHAGPGSYDLFSEEAQKTKESASGISRLFQEKILPTALQTYLSCVQQTNNRLTHSICSSLRYYPGSPDIVYSFLRKFDRMILSELHPRENALLKTHFTFQKKVTVQLMDGYQSLKAYLPPKERRGLILIDPPFERPNEFSTIIDSLRLALMRFATGIYAIWYPIKNRAIVEQFYQDMKTLLKLKNHTACILELTIYPESDALLSGSGMIIINPPWQFESQLNDFLPFLWKIFSPHGDGHYLCQILTN